MSRFSTQPPTNAFITVPAPSSSREEFVFAKPGFVLAIVRVRLSAHSMVMKVTLNAYTRRSMMGGDVSGPLQWRL